MIYLIKTEYVKANKKNYEIKLIKLILFYSSFVSNCCNSEIEGSIIQNEIMGGTLICMVIKFISNIIRFV